MTGNTWLERRHCLNKNNQNGKSGLDSSWVEKWAKTMSSVPYVTWSRWHFQPWCWISELHIWESWMRLTCWCGCVSQSRAQTSPLSVLPEWNTTAERPHLPLTISRQTAKLQQPHKLGLNSSWSCLHDNKCASRSVLSSSAHAKAHISSFCGICPAHPSTIN